MNDGLGRFKRYRLTAEGQVRGAAGLGALEEKSRDYIKTLVDFVRRVSFPELVAAIYKFYPDMKANSVFKGGEVDDGARRGLLHRRRCHRLGQRGHVRRWATTYDRAEDQEDRRPSRECDRCRDRTRGHGAAIQRDRASGSRREYVPAAAD